MSHTLIFKSINCCKSASRLYANQNYDPVLYGYYVYITVDSLTMPLSACEYQKTHATRLNTEDNHISPASVYPDLTFPV